MRIFHLTKPLIWCLLIAGPFSLSATSSIPKLDSLSRTLAETVEDSARLDVIMDLATNYQNLDIDSACRYAVLGYHLGVELKDTTAMWRAADIMSFVELYHSDGGGALPYVRGSLCFFKEQGGRKIHLGRLLGRMGVAYQSQGKYGKAQSYYLWSLSLMETHGTPADISLSLNNVGTTYHKLGEYRQARHYYQKALKIKEEDLTPNQEALGVSNIGRAYLEEGCLDSARVFFGSALEVAQEARLVPRVAMAYMDFGMLEEESGNVVAAEDYYRQSMTMFHRVGLRTHAEIVGMMLGRSLNELGRSREALALCQSAYDWDQESQDFQPLYKEQCLTCLIDAHRALNQFARAMPFADEMMAYQALQNQEVSRNEIMRIAETYQVRQKAMADSMMAVQAGLQLKLDYSQQLQTRNRWIWVVGLLGAMMILMGVLIWRAYRNKLHSNHLLEARVKRRTAELERRNDQLTELAYINSHHLRGPLARVMGMVQLVELAQDPGEQSQYLDLLRESADQLDAVVHRISDAARDATPPVAVRGPATSPVG